jgi:ATP-dependent Clp protease adapter protein ClpS
MSKGIDLLPAVLPAEEFTPQRDRTGGNGSPYVVIVYNDDWHTFDDVQQQLIKATGCTLEKAEALSIEIDGRGRAVVFGGEQAECERVANVLREIRLQVETDCS